MGLKQLRTKCEARVQEVLSHLSQDTQEQGSPSMEEHQQVVVTLPSHRVTTNLSPSHSRGLIPATSEDSSRLKMGKIRIIISTVADPYYSHVDVIFTLLVRFWEKKLFRVLL